MTLEEFIAEWQNDSDKVLVHTSGSTGAPKPLWVEKRRMEASARITCDFLGLTAGDTALLCMPLDYIAGKMMYAAREDMFNKNWTSAITRLQTIVETAQETVMTPEAMFRLTECYTAIGLPEQAEGYAKMLRKNFPDNEWTKKLK